MLGSKARSSSAQSKKLDMGLAAGTISIPSSVAVEAEGLGTLGCDVRGTTSGGRRNECCCCGCDCCWWWVDAGEAGGWALNGEAGKDGHRRRSTCSCMERAGDRGCHGEEEAEASCCDGNSGERPDQSSGSDGDGWGDGYACC